jgi:hypothetical protein
MNDFIWGLIALPLLIAGLAGLAYAAFGAWILAEKWAQSRLVKLDAIRVSERIGTSKFPMRTATQLGGRGRMAVLLLLADKAGYFKVGPNLAIALVRTKGSGGNKDVRVVQQAIERTIDKLASDGDA